MEDSVGISAFANTAPSFSCILKQRFSDFIVREVDSNGKVVLLNSIDGSGLEKSQFTSPDSEVPITDPVLAFNELCDNIRSLSGTSPCGDSITEDFKNFFTSSITRAETAPIDYIGFPGLDKATRSSIHALFKGSLSSFIDTETSQSNGVSCIRFIALHKASSGREKGTKQKRKRSNWPDNLGKYLRFTLLKENIDTMSAVDILGRATGGKIKIEYYGTKDKRAVTTQKCTIYQQKPSYFARINASKLTPRLFVGDFEYVDEPAKLGLLSGNQFELVLRALTASEDEVAASCLAMEKSGFVNYYGLQRFGKGGSKSHEIGRAIFKSDWENCVRMLFTARAGDRCEIATAKQLFEQKKYREAYDAMPTKLYAEKQVLFRLARNPTDFMGAYNSTPKFSRLICTHAYQSYVWNKAATQRLKLYGLSIVAGDLVATDPELLLEDIADDDDALMEVNRDARSGGEAGVSERAAQSQQDKDKHGCQRGKKSKLTDTGDAEPATSESNPVLSTDGNMQRCSKYRTGSIHIVTAEDVAAGRYSITDIVLPLPGWDVTLPENDVGSYYLQLLADDGISFATFSRCSQFYRTSGAYRRVIQSPQRLEWEIVSYSDPDEEIAETELARFNRCLPDRQRQRISEAGFTSSDCASSAKINVDGVSDTAVRTSESSDTAHHAVVAQDQPEQKHEQFSSLPSPPSLPQSQLKALKLQFTLPPGTYATMLLRELTKESTETQFQANLTKLSGAAFSAAPSADSESGEGFEGGASSNSSSSTTASGPDSAAPGASKSDVVPGSSVPNTKHKD